MAGRDPEVAIGMVHGRFQPFHLGHLEYILEAAARCRALVVGITNPEFGPLPEEATSPHRHLAAANPYSYDERRAMVRAALAAAGVDLARVTILPFPIHDPTRWHLSVPPGAVHFIRVFSAWEAEKATRLRAAGYEVVELPAGSKAVSGTEVRRRLDAGADWRELLPASVAELIGRSANQA